MKNKIITLSILILTALYALAAVAHAEKPFAPNVNMKTGEIRVPNNYTQWATLGTWSHANTEGEPGAKEYHIVYTQPETIVYYRKHGKYPDGAILVKELLNTKTMQMTTGLAVSHATEIKGWFVLVRDTQNRFKESSLWGDGWGWSLFNADDPIKTVSTDYKTDCIGCHLPARQMAHSSADESDKWTYSFGYLALQKK
jgi:hypothetical protein